MFVINDTLGAYGGSHTLMLRMCKWLSNNKVSSAIICKEATNEEIVEQLRALGTIIICVDLSNIKEGITAIRRLTDREPIKVMSFNLYNYLNLETVKKRAGLSFDHFIYCIHHRSFEKGASIRNRFLKNLYLKGYKKLYLRMHDNNSVVMIDELNEKSSNGYYGVDRKFDIIPLPMFCERDTAESSIIENGFSENMIMTATRAEFPFKGYLIGLIDAFAELKNGYKDLKLVIVSAGDDIGKVHEKVKSLPAEISNDINIISWLSYEELREHIKRCKVFVGMGTSVLDAALLFKPSVVVSLDTYECKSNHLIADQPDKFSIEANCEENAIDIIRRIIDLDFESYSKEATRSYENVANYYNIDNAMAMFLKLENRNKQSILKATDYFRHIINNWVNSVRMRNIKNRHEWGAISK